MQSQATTVTAYLDELPPERRAVVAGARELVLANLPEGYEEGLGYGMLTYTIPLSRYPKTHNRQPLCYVALAAQKQHTSLYLMSVYADSREERELRAAFAAAGKKLDLGKSCVRFRRLEDVDLPALGRAIAAQAPDAFIARYEASRQRSRRRGRA